MSGTLPEARAKAPTSRALRRLTRVAAIALLALVAVPRSAHTDPVSYTTWDLAGDYGAPNAQAYGIGPEGAWSFGDDVAGSGNPSGVTPYNYFTGGYWLYNNDAFPPGAIVATIESGTPAAFHSHEAHPAGTRANVAIWTAPRDMTVAAYVAAWTPADGTQNLRSHTISFSQYGADGTTQLWQRNGVIGARNAGSSYASRWKSATTTTMLAGQTLSFWHNHQGSPGWVGIEFKVTEVSSLTGHFTDLGTLGGTVSEATAINASGQIVGWSYTAGNAAQHAFLFSDGTMTDLGTLGGSYSYPTAINASGQVVGYAETANHEYHAFLFSDNAMADLGTLPGGHYSEATAINANGQVVGQAQTTNGEYHAFLFSDGTMTDLVGLPGDSYSHATAINASGQVVGRSSGNGSGGYRAFLFSDGAMMELNLGGFGGGAEAINDNGQAVGQARTASGDAHAFLYSDGTMTDLGTLGGTASRATAINDSGQIVGSSYATGDSAEHAFLYSDGMMTDLGTLGGSNSTATAINASGQVVGVSNALYNSGSHGFAYSDGVMTDLGTLGGSYSQATAINDAGQVVGYAYAANGSYHAALAVIPDTTAPSVTCPANLVLEATGSSGATATWSGGSASDLVDGSLTVTYDHASGNTFAVGTTTVTGSATDAHGNIGTCSFTVTVQDTTPPTITPPADVVVEATSASGQSVMLGTATASDLFGATASNNAPATFDLGTTTVTWTATDAHGLTATATQHVTVVDTTAPVVTGCPSSLTLEATGPNGALATWTPPRAIDAVDGEIDDAYISQPGRGDGRVIELTRPNGERINISAELGRGYQAPLGTSHLVYVFKDSHGNRTYCGGFDVTVVDTTAPAIAGRPADITKEALSAAGATVTWTSPTATDLVDGSRTVSCTPASGSIFALGVTTVTCASTDAHGNSATATFTVTVRDTTPPTLTVPSSITAEATSRTGAVVIFSASASDLVDGTRTVTCSPASGSTFAIGSTTVSCTATDSHGNVGHGSFLVTVADRIAPTLSVSGVPATLSPVNKKLVTIVPVIAVSDVYDPSPLVAVVVTCNEALVAGNVVVHSATNIELRATRDAKGTGRIYTLTFTATDGSGNRSTVVKTVTVPK